MGRSFLARLTGSIVAAGLLGLITACPAAAQTAGTQTDITTLVGFSNLTNGYHDQIFASALGNTLFSNGVGMHSEITYVNREETGALFTGGLSYNTDHFSIRGMLGTSTDVQSILPDFYGRLSAEFKGSPADGFIINPAYMVRTFREGLTDQSAELRLVKYLPAGPDASVILEAIGRAGFLDPGPSWIPSGMAGITYASYKNYSFGVAIDAGRAEYDALVGIGSVNEPYYAIRPSASMYVNKNTELFARADYTHRESYQASGGLVGLKIYLDE